MSCGDHHDVDCAEVLQRVFVFLDHEIDDASCAEIEQHLNECGPCLRKFDLERTVKSLVARSCCEQAPEELRAKVLLAISRVQITITES